MGETWLCVPFLFPLWIQICMTAREASTHNAWLENGPSMWHRQQGRRLQTLLNALGPPWFLSFTFTFPVSHSCVICTGCAMVNSFACCISKVKSLFIETKAPHWSGGIAVTWTDWGALKTHTLAESVLHKMRVLHYSSSPDKNMTWKARKHTVHNEKQ